jgi:dolichol-phosphate mannosyltransferase
MKTLSGMLPRLYILVPVFNEALNLDILLSSFRSLGVELGQQFRIRFILVDDGSRDGTAAKAKELGAGLPLEVLSHPINQGPGKAFATGFAHIAPEIENGDWVITMEGDNTSRHELIRQMFQRSQEGFDVILASPYMYGGGIENTSFLRTFLSHGANLLVKELLGIHGILTMSSFFRLYRGQIIRKLQGRYGPGIIERAGFESMVELLMKLTIHKAAISEVAMVLDTKRRKGKSKMKIGKTMMGYCTLWKDRRRWV